jgi:Raf kinase inhibitor-like YbhB/YbcL family protein
MMMWIRSDNFEDGGPIPVENALGMVDSISHVTFVPNRSPQLEWGDVPDGTKSLALSVIDQDVPTVGDDVNQEGREVPPDLPRTTFTHWLLVDIPPDTRVVSEGEFSQGVIPHGKPGLSERPREGVNDYTGWFADDNEMAGTYRGYDGPGPPWNDSIIHHYEFKIIALDVETLDLASDFTAADLERAAAGHILDSASITGIYALNPRLLPL